MATKIDLLPGYVKWTKRFHYTIAGAIVGLCLWTGGLILVYHSKQLELQTALENQAAAQTVADQATTAANNAVQANTEAGGYTAANDFFCYHAKRVANARRFSILLTTTSTLTRWLNPLTFPMALRSLLWRPSPLPRNILASCYTFATRQVSSSKAILVSQRLPSADLAMVPNPSSYLNPLLEARLWLSTIPSHCKPKGR